MYLIFMLIILCVIAIPEMGIKGFLFLAGLTSMVFIGEWVWNNAKKEKKYGKV